MSDTPDLTIEPRSFWCSRHLEPFRPHWPVGYLPATLALLSRALQLPAIVEAAGGDSRMVDRVMREYGPVCCLLGDEVVGDVTRRALSDDIEDVRELVREAAPRVDDAESKAGL